MERFRPRVEGLRRLLFGKDEAPFASLLEAEQWIEMESPRPRGRTKKDLREAEGLFREIESKLRRYRTLVGREVVVSERTRILPYLKPDRDRLGTVTIQFSETRTPLAELAEVSRKLTDATGFAQQDVVAPISSQEHSRHCP